MKTSFLSFVFCILYSVLLDWYFFPFCPQVFCSLYFLLNHGTISFRLLFRSYFILPYIVSFYSFFLSPFRMVIKTLYAAALIHVAQGVWMLGSRCNLNSHTRCYLRLYQPFLFTSSIPHVILSTSNYVMDFKFLSVSVSQNFSCFLPQ